MVSVPVQRASGSSGWTAVVVGRIEPDQFGRIDDPIELLLADQTKLERRFLERETVVA
jgi:hypothetical protein